MKGSFCPTGLRDGTEEHREQRLEFEPQTEACNTPEREVCVCVLGADLCEGLCGVLYV